MTIASKNNISASLVIPVFNNGDTLVEQIKECEEIISKIISNYEIIICDDKSTDNSAHLLRKHFQNKSHFNIIFHSKNKGIAKTIRELYSKAKLDNIVLFSVDGCWNPKDIEKLLLQAIESKSDIVIGKRNKSQYSMYRKIISFFYNTLPIIFFGVKTTDAGSIKVIRKKIFDSTKLVSKSVFFEAEIIIKAKKNGKVIESVPIHFKKHKNKKGSGGKINLVASSLRDIFILRLNI